MANDQSWIADLLAGYKQVNLGGLPLERRNFLNLVSGFSAVDNPSGGDGGLGSTDLTSTAGQWVNGADLDLTAQPNQTFATDTTYSYAGMTGVTKFRSIADASAAASVNGTGLVFQATTGNVSTIGAAALEFTRLHLPLSQIPGLANVAHDWPLRIMVRVASVTSTAAAQALLALAPNANSVPGFYAISKGQTNAFQGYRSDSASAGGFTLTDSGAYGTYDSICLSFPGGLSGGVAGGLLATYSSGWPSASALYWAGCLSMGNEAMGGIAGPIANWGINLGAAASSVAVTAVFSRLRVDYQPK